MNSKLNFDEFYKMSLLPEIRLLDSARKTTINWLIFGIGSAIFALINLICAYILHTPFWPTFIFSALVIISIFFYTKSKDQYIINFKEKIIRLIANQIYPGIVYKPSRSVKAAEYKASGLYRKHYEYYDGNDYMSGVYKNINFHCSELYTEYVSGTVNGRMITVFKGLFLVAEVGAYHHTATFVWPKHEEQFGSGILAEDRLLRIPAVHRIKTSNENFEKLFSVYGNNNTAASAFLSEEMMARMISLNKLLKRQIRFSLVGGRFYLAVPIDRDLLIPSMWHSINEAEVKEYYISFLFIFRIMEQLELHNLL